nr:immunoglobulin heavy chain junction region [Macaca mulatta]MOW46038.1 immunoglobulin heavy chain junction region [Macaca mulatta]MOW46133.1 immunoglobulin heavy chain junction region [Macaca mulatta]MOW46605.1 immunoglobulin heavy chain junction region [Macaca mulatta]MOW46638.1 immunoglobulin heavy chain junction region [Macaca mulatta]
CVNGITALDYW